MFMGAVQMWVEILDINDQVKTPVWKIAQRPKEKFEIRIIVWNTEDVKIVDGEFNDLKILCTIGKTLPKIHYN